MIEKIFETAGGTLEIAYNLKVHQASVDRWKKDGIPEKHWQYFVGKGITPQEIYDANMGTRDENNNGKDA